MAIVNATSGIRPTTCAGKRCSTGNKNPVRLVKAVVARKILVHPSRGLLVSNPYRTTNPEPIPARLINTCRRVNVDLVIPRIMMISFQEARAEVL
jgi:hypothetical protein